MKKLSFTSLLLLLAWLPIKAEFLSTKAMATPIIKINYDSDIIDKNSILNVTILLEHGWKINSNKLADEFLVPSSLKAKAQGILFSNPIFPAPDTLFIESLNMKNTVFHDSINIKVPISQISDQANTQSTTVSFTYQACNDKICLAPATISKAITDNNFFTSSQNNESIMLEEAKEDINDKNLNSIDVQKPLKATIENKSLNSSNDGSNASKSLQVKSKSNLAALQNKLLAKTTDGINANKANIKISKSTEAPLQINSNALKPLSNTPPSLPKPAGSLIYMLFLAFIGGLILNLMPCVLPVLSLKIMSLVKQAHESRKQLIKLSSSMTFGVLSSFWVLSAIIVFLKSTGESIGWGFQFQNPWFLVSMILLMIVLSANLFGFFEFVLPGSSTTKMNQASQKEGLSGAFFTGVFMTLLSTPCSAPLLGVSLGYAFSQPGPIIFLLFTFIGLGLATPYMLLAIFPKVLRYFPKPGNWMVVLKTVMGVPVLITGIWLITVLNHSVNFDTTISIIVISIVTAIFLFVYGKYIQPKQMAHKSFSFLGFSILVVALLLNQDFHPRLEKPLENQTPIESLEMHQIKDAAGKDVWLNWSPELMQNALQTDHIIFLDFTAKWCVSCKANEAAILNNSTIKALFKKNNVIKIKADWTQSDPRITAELNKFNRSGVPLYVVYSLKKRNPEVLPEIITNGIVQSAIATAKKN